MMCSIVLVATTADAVTLNMVKEETHERLIDSEGSADPSGRHCGCTGREHVGPVGFTGKIEKNHSRKMSISVDAASAAHPSLTSDTQVCGQRSW